MAERQRVVVIGAGAAGSSAAVELKRVAPDLDVVVVGAEERGPYNRTTVNKGLLTGAVGDHEVNLPGLDDLGIAWRLGESVKSVDPFAGVVELASGTRLAGDAFVLATGADPRPLPTSIDPSAGDRVLALRTTADTARLRAALDGPSPHVMIAGAGLLGSETAGSLRGLGVDVTLVDSAARPLSAHMGMAAAEWVRAEHVGAAVDVRTSTRVAGVDDVGGRLFVTLDDGSAVQSNVVVASLGVIPAVGWLRDSGILLSDGVPVDSGMRVIGRPRFYAAGDLAAVPGPDGVPVRIEHWGAALAQGRTAAASLLADLGLTASRDGAPAVETPSYSTYVHGTKLTIVGWVSAAIAETVVHGAVGQPRFTIALLDSGRRIVAAVGVGGARVANRLRDLIASRAEIAEVEAAVRSAA